MIISFTGHRPPKAGLHRTHAGRIDHDYVNKIVGNLLVEDVSHTVVGGAMGWDTLAARASYLAKIPFHLYLPFEGYEIRYWPEEYLATFQVMRKNAAEVKVVCEGGYASHKMQLRNMAMVNNSDEVWALFDGTPKGGTFNCVEYAKAVGKPVRNFYSESSLSPTQS